MANNTILGISGAISGTINNQQSITGSLTLPNQVFIADGVLFVDSITFGAGTQDEVTLTVSDINKLKTLIEQI